MKKLYKNLLLLNKIKACILLLIVFNKEYKLNSQNIANFITNGGFEKTQGCLPYLPYLNNCVGWRTIDSQFVLGAQHRHTCAKNIPFGMTSNLFQYPLKGSGYSSRATNNFNQLTQIQFSLSLLQNESSQNDQNKVKGLNNKRRFYKTYPNPSTGDIFVKSPTPVDVLDVSISDVSGRYLLFKTIAITDYIGSINCNLKNGIYFMTVKNSNNETFTFKVILQK